MPPEQELSTAEAARRLGCSRQTVLHWVALGRLPATRTPSGHYRFDPVHVDRLAHGQHAVGPPLPDDDVEVLAVEWLDDDDA
jgi:excisionase family DNA binding protein